MYVMRLLFKDLNNKSNPKWENISNQSILLQSLRRMPRKMPGAAVVKRSSTEEPLRHFI